MRYVDIFVEFLRKFPYYQEYITAFAPAGKNTILVEMNNGQNVRFTYFNADDWRINSEWTN